MKVKTEINQKTKALDIFIYHEDNASYVHHALKIDDPAAFTHKLTWIMNSIIMATKAQYAPI